MAAMVCVQQCPSEESNPVIAPSMGTTGQRPIAVTKRILTVTRENVKGRMQELDPQASEGVSRTASAATGHVPRSSADQADISRK